MHPWAVEAQAQATKALDAVYERESTPGDTGTPYRWVEPASIVPLVRSSIAGASPMLMSGVPMGVAWVIEGTPWCLLFASNDIPNVLPHFKLKRHPPGSGFSVSMFVPVVLFRVIEALIGGPLTDVNAVDLGELPEDALREVGDVGALGGHAAAVHVLQEVYKVRASGCQDMTPVRWSLDQ